MATDVLYRVFHLMQDSRTGCIALRLGQGKVSRALSSPLTPHLPLTQAERCASHSTVLYLVKHPVYIPVIPLLAPKVFFFSVLHTFTS